MTDYCQDFVDQAYNLCLLFGATGDELAKFFGVCPATIDIWKKKHPDFGEAVRNGGVVADSRVARRFYERAMGYEHEAVKIFMPAGRDEPVYAKYIERYPPDTAAATVWLHNRQPEKWRRQNEVTGKDGGPIVTETVYRWADPKELPTPEK